MRLGGGGGGGSKDWAATVDTAIIIIPGLGIFNTRLCAIIHCVIISLSDGDKDMILWLTLLANHSYWQFGWITFFYGLFLALDVCTCMPCMEQGWGGGGELVWVGVWGILSQYNHGLKMFKMKWQYLIIQDEIMKWNSKIILK